jgi:hypothetical protein
MVYLAIIGIPIGTFKRMTNYYNNKNNFMKPPVKIILAFLVTFLLAFGTSGLF